MRTLAILALIALPAVANAKLEIRDMQASQGQLGPERKSNEYVVGDQVYYRFTISGVRTDADGRTRAEMKIIVTDAKGKKLISNTFPFQQVIALGGDSFPGAASFHFDDTSMPGDYELAVEFTDLLSKETASFKRKVVCKPETFALLNVRFFRDRDGQVPARVGGTVGERLVVKMQIVGFDRSKDEIDVGMEVAVLDAKGKPATANPILSEFHSEKPPEVRATSRIALSANLVLNRPGDFVLRVTVTDRTTKKKVTFEAPMRVVPL
jgi:hypothetical protein